MKKFNLNNSSLVKNILFVFSVCAQQIAVCCEKQSQGCVQAQSELQQIQDYQKQIQETKTKIFEMISGFDELNSDFFAKALQALYYDLVKSIVDGEACLASSHYPDKLKVDAYALLANYGKDITLQLEDAEGWKDLIQLTNDEHVEQIYEVINQGSPEPFDPVNGKIPFQSFHKFFEEIIDPDKYKNNLLLQRIALVLSVVQQQIAHNSHCCSLVQDWDKKFPNKTDNNDAMDEEK